MSTEAAIWLGGKVKTTWLITINLKKHERYYPELAIRVMLPYPVYARSFNPSFVVLTTKAPGGTPSIGEIFSITST